MSALDIANALVEKGFDLDRRRVRLEEPIKRLGSFEVTVNVHRDMAVTVPLHVVRPGAQLVIESDEAAPADEPVVEARVEDPQPPSAE